MLELLELFELRWRLRRLRGLRRMTALAVELPVDLPVGTGLGWRPETAWMIHRSEGIAVEFERSSGTGGAVHRILSRAHGAGDSRCL